MYMFFCIIALVVSLVSETVMPMLHVLKEMPCEVFVYMLLPETNGVSLEAEIP